MLNLTRYLTIITLLLAVQASYAGLIWDTRMYGAGADASGFIKTDNGTFDQLGRETFNITGFSTSSSSANIPKYHEWEMIGQGTIVIDPIHKPSNSPKRYTFDIPLVKAPIYVSTELFGTPVTILKTQLLGFNKSDHFDKIPRDSGWAGFSDNLFRPWQRCADEWSLSIETGYYNSDGSCINNDGVDPHVPIGLFRFEINVNATEVPEPSSLVLLALGLAGLGTSRSKKLRSSSLRSR